MKLPIAMGRKRPILKASREFGTAVFVSGKRAVVKADGRGFPRQEPSETRLDNSFFDSAMPPFDSNLSLQIDRAVQGVERTNGRTRRLWQAVLSLLLRRLP